MTSKHGRYFRPKPTSLKGTPYDSLTEQRLHQGILNRVQFHQHTLEYEWPHTYEPDFCIGHEDNRITFIEVKGYFQDRNDCTKYLWIREALDIGEDLVFVFEDPDKPMHFQAKRKDGTKMTMREWAEKNKFRWFTEDTISELLT